MKLFLMQKNKKILIIKLAAIGDVVHTTIIPKAIKEKHPDWQIHYLTQEEISPIVKNQNFIDKVFTWDSSKKDSFKYLFETVAKLRAEKYDIIFNLTFAIRNFILSVGAFPKKIAFRKYNTGTWVEDYFNSAKSVIKDLEIPKNLQLDVEESAKDKVKEILKQYPKPYILISPGTYYNGRQGRIWDMEKWQKLSSKLLNIFGGTIFVNGSKGEYEYHKQLAKDNIIVISGKYDLKHTCAVTSLMDLVISGDSGPLHIATALNVNTLALLGSTSPDKIKPYGEKGYYIEPAFDCKYCWKKKCKFTKDGQVYTPCIESIMPEVVIEKILNNNLIEQLQRTP